MSDNEFDSIMDPELKETVYEVIAEIQKIEPNLSDLNSLTVLDKEVVDKFCKIHDIQVVPAFEAHMNTPFAIGKYLTLVVEQNNIISRLEEELKLLLDTEKVNWLIYKDFSGQINFSNNIQINSEEKPQSLLVKYRLDPELDKIIYTILAGSWGWDITGKQLKGLLENTAIEKENVENKVINRVTNEDAVVINMNGIKITLEKQ